VQHSTLPYNQASKSFERSGSQKTLSLEKAEMLLSGKLLLLLPVPRIQDKFIPLVTLSALHKIQL